MQFKITLSDSQYAWEIHLWPCRLLQITLIWLYQILAFFFFFSSFRNRSQQPLCAVLWTVIPLQPRSCHVQLPAAAVACICPAAFQTTELLSPGVTCVTGCCSTWQEEHAVPNKNPKDQNKPFCWHVKSWGWTGKHIWTFLHCLALLNYLGKR